MKRVIVNKENKENVPRKRHKREEGVKREENRRGNRGEYERESVPHNSQVCGKYFRSFPGYVCVWRSKFCTIGFYIFV